LISFHTLIAFINPSLHILRSKASYFFLSQSAIHLAYSVSLLNSTRLLFAMLAPSEYY
jgi:hypothetical protein